MAQGGTAEVPKDARCTRRCASRVCVCVCIEGERSVSGWKTFRDGHALPSCTPPSLLLGAFPPPPLPERDTQPLAHARLLVEGNMFPPVPRARLSRRDARRLPFWCAPRSLCALVSCDHLHAVYSPPRPPLESRSCGRARASSHRVRLPVTAATTSKKSWARRKHAKREAQERLQRQRRRAERDGTLGLTPTSTAATCDRAHAHTPRNSTS